MPQTSQIVPPRHFLYFQILLTCTLTHNTHHDHHGSLYHYGSFQNTSTEDDHGKYNMLCLELLEDKAGEASTPAFRRVKSAYYNILVSRHPVVLAIAEAERDSKYDSDSDSDLGDDPWIFKRYPV
jgi:hypothetical protein